MQSVEFCLMHRVVGFGLENGIDRAGRIDLANSRIKCRKGVEFARLLRKMEVNEAIQGGHNTFLFFSTIHDLSYTIVITDNYTDYHRCGPGPLSQN